VRGSFEVLLGGTRNSTLDATAAVTGAGVAPREV